MMTNKVLKGVVGIGVCVGTAMLAKEVKSKKETINEKSKDFLIKYDNKAETKNKDNKDTVWGIWNKSKNDDDNKTKNKGKGLWIWEN